MAKAKAIKSILEFLKNPEARMQDFQDLSKVPDVPQEPIERYMPRNRPATLDGGLLEPENAERIEAIAREGAQRGGLEWYNPDPLRSAFVEELGKDGTDAFNRFVDYTAATSPRAKVTENIRRGSYFYQQDRLGNQVGGLTKHDLPKGYGHMAHKTHDHKLREIEENGGLLPLKSPKTASFAENLKGNQRPITVDTHNMAALKDDATWRKSPADTQYRYLEEFQTDIADKLGMTPAQLQASVWVAGDTGVANTQPFIAAFDEVLKRTAKKNKVSQDQALKDFINGKEPLWGMAGLMSGLQLMDDNEVDGLLGTEA